MMPSENRFTLFGIMLWEASHGWLGSLTILHVEVTPEFMLVVQTEGGDTTPLHSQIALDIAPAACHLFRLDGPALAPL